MIWVDRIWGVWSGDTHCEWVFEWVGYGLLEGCSMVYLGRGNLVSLIHTESGYFLGGYFLRIIWWLWNKFVSL